MVGSSTAFFLSRAGMSVVLVERDSIGSHASGSAYGGLTPVMGIQIDSPVIPLSRLAEELHANLAYELPELTGIDTEYRKKQGLHIATNDAELKEMRAAQEWLSKYHKGRTEWLDSEDLSRFEPRLSQTIHAGIYTESCYEVEPYKFTLAMAQAAESSGAKIVNATAVGLLSQAGRVTGVKTKNQVLQTGTVILAAGPWTGLTSDWFDFEIPIEPLKGQIIRLDAPGDPLDLSFSWTGNYATSKPDSLLWAGTTEEQSHFDETPTQEGVQTIMATLVSVFPYLIDARLAQHTACLRPLTPDRMPIVCSVPRFEGVFIASGTGRNGILLGPAMGCVVSDMVLGKPPTTDVRQLGLARFFTDQI